jgi:hypothetical protein
MFKPTTAQTPTEYLKMIDEPRKSEVTELFQFICKLFPQYKPFILVGMIGWKPYHYKSKSGREGDWATISLASQKNYISVYACAVDGAEYVAEKYKKLLPKASIGKSCIRFKKAGDIDYPILKKLLLETDKLPFPT